MLLLLVNFSLFWWHFDYIFDYLKLKRFCQKCVLNLMLCRKFKFISLRQWKQILLFDSITKINCIKGEILCPRVQCMTFKTNRGLNFIKKIYYKESCITFLKPCLINSVLKVNWIKCHVILCNDDIRSALYQDQGPWCSGVKLEYTWHPSRLREWESLWKATLRQFTHTQWAQCRVHCCKSLLGPPIQFPVNNLLIILNCYPRNNILCSNYVQLFPNI